MQSWANCTISLKLFLLYTTRITVPSSLAYHGCKGVDAETDARTVGRWSSDAAGPSWGDPLCQHSHSH